MLCQQEILLYLWPYAFPLRPKTPEWTSPEAGRSSEEKIKPPEAGGAQTWGQRQKCLRGTDAVPGGWGQGSPPHETGGRPGGIFSFSPQHTRL